MLVEKSHYLAPQVCGNGDGDIAGEKPKGQRKADLKVWFGKLCFSAKDFAKPRFISVAVIKGQPAGLQHCPRLLHAFRILFLLQWPLSSY